ncbi:membrane protein FxsA [bacterium LRH843]|nr:membrane protein FxsA [bacterium LRH843]
MFRLILLLLILIPAIEITILIIAGKAIGIWPTFLLILLTGGLGAWLAKKEGLHAIRLAQLQMQQGQLPSNVVLDGICILVGGIFLVLPGFITDVIGLFLLIPFTRAVAKALLLTLFHRMIKKGQFIILSRK